jgi:hypothetical protein
LFSLLSQLPGIGSWLLFYLNIVLPMDKYEIRKNIIIIALDNLVNTYTDALEFLNEEEKELASLIIEEAKEMLSDQKIPNTIPRPKWNS